MTPQRTFWIFSIINLRLPTTNDLLERCRHDKHSHRESTIPSTMTMRLRNPRKLGAAVESWLKHDGLVCECTAATWRYFFCSVLDSRSLVVPLGGSTDVRSALPSVEALRRDTEPTEASTLVVVEASAGDAILRPWHTLYKGYFAVVIHDRFDEGDELDGSGRDEVPIDRAPSQNRGA